MLEISFGNNIHLRLSRKLQWCGQRRVRQSFQIYTTEMRPFSWQKCNINMIIFLNPRCFKMRYYENPYQLQDVLKT